MGPNQTYKILHSKKKPEKKKKTWEKKSTAWEKIFANDVTVNLQTIQTAHLTQ